MGTISSIFAGDPTQNGRLPAILDVRCMTSVVTSSVYCTNCFMHLDIKQISGDTWPRRYAFYRWPSSRIVSSVLLNSSITFTLYTLNAKSNLA